MPAAAAVYDSGSFPKRDPVTMEEDRVHAADIVRRVDLVLQKFNVYAQLNRCVGSSPNQCRTMNGREFGDRIKAITHLGWIEGSNSGSKRREWLRSECFATSLFHPNARVCIASGGGLQTIGTGSAIDYVKNGLSGIGGEICSSPRLFTKAHCKAATSLRQRLSSV
jgi:hypothetical protein